MLTRLIYSIIATACLASPAMAQDRTRQTQPGAVISPATATLVEGGYYTNNSGISVHRPAHTTDGQAPAGASAQCRDGSFSFSVSRRGTCSHHGGVANWL